MRLDRANRSFLASMLLALVLGAFVLCGALGGVLVPLVLVRASHGQLGGLPELAPTLVFIILTVVGLGLGVRSLTLQLDASIRLARRVRALALAGNEGLNRAAVASRLAGRVIVVDAPVAFSFVYGLLTPRVAVSRGLLEGTLPAELRVILEHERYHVCNLDPLKAVLLRTLAAALFFIPALNWLCRRYLAGRELAADRRAVAVCGRRPLAGALLKVLGGPAWEGLPLAAAVGEQAVLDARLAQLESGLEPQPQPLSLTGLALSLSGLATVVAVFVVSVSEFGGGQAVYRATGNGLAGATLLSSLLCTAPIAGAGLLVFSLIALRARRPLPRCAKRAALGS